MDFFRRIPLKIIAGFALVGTFISIISYFQCGISLTTKHKVNRLSKEEKRAQKYVQRKNAKRMKNKNRRVKEVEKKRKYESTLTDEERIQKRLLKKKEIEDQIALQHAAFDCTGTDQGPLQLAVDLGYADCLRVAHSAREQHSLVKQLCYVYRYVRYARTPPALHLTSCRGETAEQLSNQGADKWIVKRHTSSVFEAFEKEKLVYLTPDSPTVLWTIDCTKVYVLGGIVDRSVKKGRSLARAAEAEVTTARLPIQEIYPKRTTHVLNIDAVTQAMILFYETGSWEQALDSAVPKRLKEMRSRWADKKNRACLAAQSGPSLSGSGQDDECGVNNCETG